MRHGGWRRAVPVIGAVAIVAGVSLLTVTVLGALDGDGDTQTVGLGPDDAGSTTTEPRTTTTVRRTTTTTTAPAPEVLGDVTEREGDAEPAEDPAAPPPEPAPQPAAGPAPPPPPPPTTAAPPPTAPPTTTCRNSTDPACGPLVWDPEPGEYEVVVEEVSVPLRVQAGREVTFAVDHVERAGAEAIGACASWSTDAPGVPNVSTCEAVNHSCARYGPHDPPAARTDRVRVSRTFTFPEPGRFQVSVGGHTATHLADGCGNPYLASWNRTYTVVVEE